MTATEITTSSPADATEGPNSKTGSPVKEKTPAEVKEEATTLLNNGKRDLLLSNVPDAVSKLAQACELLSKAFGETAMETGETYYYYGKALLELSRMESGVLGNALEGVPEEDAEGNTSQFEDPEKMTDQEKDQVNEVVTEAFEENFTNLEEKKTKAEAVKDDKAAEADKDDKAAEADKPDDKGEEAKKEGAEGEDKAESMEEGDDEEETEDEEGESAGEGEETKESGDGEKKGEDEEPSNLQLAWEMLELAKVVYSKQLETGADNKTEHEERLISIMLALGEVSIENENYKQAVEDIQECLKKEESLAKDARIVAETHYQLGVAQGFNAQYDEAVESLNNAINILKTRIGNLQKAEDDGTKKEVADLQALIPEIEEKINDTKDMKKESEKSDGAQEKGFGATKTAEVKPVSSIAVKRKAEEDDSSNKKLASEKETAAAS